MTYNAFGFGQIIEIQIDGQIRVKFTNGTINVLAKNLFDLDLDQLDTFSS